MKTSPSPLGFSRTVSAALGTVLFMLASMFTGCVSVVKVDSNPPGASVTVGGRSIGTTPTQYQIENPSRSVAVYFSLPGYFPKSFSYTAGQNPEPIMANLAPTTLKKSFDLTSDPAGATVTLEGKPAGTTPTTVPVEFQRASENAPWLAQRVSLAKTDYQSETVTLTSDLGSVPAVPLVLLKDQRTYSLTAANMEGAVLNAPVTLDGKAVGATPLKLPITYQRPDKTKPWPTFNVTMEMPGQYKPASAELSYTRDTTVALKLVAITEIPVKYFVPTVALTPVGAAFTMVERAVIGTLRTSDDTPAVTDLKPVTKYERQDMRPANRVESINSYTVTPDGQNVIFALSEADENGSRYSVLKIKRADDPAGGISTLTTGTRSYDTQPFIVNDGSNYLVFTSNRGDRNKADVFRVNLIEGKIVGGLGRLTSDSRFNFAPTYGDSNRQLFYLSVEPGYPKAETQLSSIRFDGSLPTQLPVVAEQINNTHPEKILFVRSDPETKKQQIYSITADGKLETALINDESYRKSNCFSPYMSTDGQTVLFVSDHTTGAKEDRANNNIYVINADGSNLQQLTTNESDDTAPQWSPTEEGVIYFLSTRGGATNIWRFKLVTGR
jgi:Tol biopolymer transport system component